MHSASIELLFVIEQREAVEFHDKEGKTLVLLGAGLCLASPTHAHRRTCASPDLVLINGKVLTMDDRSSVVEALAILDGKILATGSNASVKSVISHGHVFSTWPARLSFPGLSIPTRISKPPASRNTL